MFLLSVSWCRTLDSPVASTPPHENQGVPRFVAGDEWGPGDESAHHFEFSHLVLLSGLCPIGVPDAPTLIRPPFMGVAGAEASGWSRSQKVSVDCRQYKLRLRLIQHVLPQAVIVLGAQLSQPFIIRE